MNAERVQPSRANLLERIGNLLVARDKIDINLQALQEELQQLYGTEPPPKVRLKLDPRDQPLALKGRYGRSHSSTFAGRELDARRIRSMVQGEEGSKDSSDPSDTTDELKEPH